MKRKAQATGVINRSIFEEWDTFYLSEKQTISLTKCDVEINTKYSRKKLGQSLPLLKDGVNAFRTLTLVGNGSYRKIYKTTNDQKTVKLSTES